MFALQRPTVIRFIRGPLRQGRGILDLLLKGRQFGTGRGQGRFGRSQGFLSSARTLFRGLLLRLQGGGPTFKLGLEQLQITRLRHPLLHLQLDLGFSGGDDILSRGSLALSHLQPLQRHVVLHGLQRQIVVAPQELRLGKGRLVW